MGINIADTPEEFRRCIPGSQRKELGKVAATFEESNDKHDAKLEAEIHEQIDNTLKQHRGVKWVHHCRMDKKTTSPKGTPDFLFAYRYFFFGVEVKLPCKKLSADQLRTSELMSIDGWQWRLVHSMAEFKETVLDWADAQANSLPMGEQ